jgi:hypothetical protein
MNSDLGAQNIHYRNADAGTTSHEVIGDLAARPRIQCIAMRNLRSNTAPQ